MIIISFNINGIRSHIHQLKKIINIYNPYFIGLQETKVCNENFPIKIFNDFNYYVYFNGYKNHFGVSLASKIKPIKIYYNFLNSNILFKYRIIIGEFKIKDKHLLLINLYVPQGENVNSIKFDYKICFIENLIKYIKSIINKNIYILIFGDINISPYDKDIGINYFLKKKNN